MNIAQGTLRIAVMVQVGNYISLFLCYVIIYMLYLWRSKNKHTLKYTLRFWHLVGFSRWKTT